MSRATIERRLTMLEESKRNRETATSGGVERAVSHFRRYIIDAQDDIDAGRVTSRENLSFASTLALGIVHRGGPIRSPEVIEVATKVLIWYLLNVDRASIESRDEWCRYLDERIDEFEIGHLIAPRVADTSDGR